jgi:hypothetical protein
MNPDAAGGRHADDLKCRRAPLYNATRPIGDDFVKPLWETRSHGTD